MLPVNRRNLCAGVLALGLCAGVAIAASNQVKVGDEFPNLTKFQFDGKLPDTLPGKVVIVDFWASWCGPCKASFPVMEQLYQRYGKDGLVIVAVNLDDNRADMDGFLKKNPVSFAVVRDASKQLVSKVDIASMPTSFVIDSTGKVRSMHNGFRGEETKKKYVQEIEDLLKAASQQAKKQE
jgi:thiol-disulfide isomerase/thioredoxin